jgi:transcriptional regulator with XRE-family HTH domain
MKRADSVDAIVGHNIRIQRLMRGLSQHELGDLLGVSFQQVQKYEKGTNRVSAGRLHRLADALNLPVSAFYASARSNPAESQKPHQPSPLSLIANPDSLRLVQCFNKIKNRAVRRSLVNLVGRLAGHL